MEVVASVGVILQIAGELGHLSRKVSRCVSKIKHAKKQIAVVDKDVNLFSCAFNLFHTTVQTAIDQKLSFAENPIVSDLVHHIRCAGVSRLADIRIILETLNALREDKGSGASRITARFLWMILDQREIKDLLSGMLTVCTAINGFHSAATFHLYLKDIEKLRAENKQVPEALRKKIKLLKAEVKRRADECEDAQQKYETLRRSTGTSGESIPTIELVASLVKQIARNEVRRENEIERDASSGMSSQSSSHPPPTIPESEASAINIRPLNPRRTSVRIPSDVFVPPPPPSEHEVVTNISLERSPSLESPGTPMTRASSPPSEAELHIVIHDDGTMVHEEFRRPRKPINYTTDSEDDE